MKNFAFIILVALFSKAGAQKYYNDAQFRFNLGLEKRITKRFSVTLDQQDRWNKNISEFNRGSLDIGLAYKLSKNVKIKADYVYIQKRGSKGFFSQRNWYYVAVVLKHETGNWKFFYRNLAQVRMSPENSEEAGIMRFYDRNKVTIRYEASKRYTLWVAGEIYIPLNSPQTKGIERTRYYAGITIKTTKNQSLDLYFMYQEQLQRNKWFDQSYKYQNGLMNRYFVYGVNYDIAF